MILCVILGLVLIADAATKLEKIKHIYWTKQALREYDESKYGVMRALQSTDTSAEKYCVRCGRELSPEAEFCYSCGASQPTSSRVEILSEEGDLLAQRERISKLLDQLDEKLVAGEISETTYKELKSKYSKKLTQVKRSIKTETSRKKEKSNEQAKIAELPDSPSVPTHKERKIIPTDVCPSCKKKITETHR